MSKSHFTLASFLVSIL